MSLFLDAFMLLSLEPPFFDLYKKPGIRTNSAIITGKTWDIQERPDKNKKRGDKRYSPEEEVEDFFILFCFAFFLLN